MVLLHPAGISHMMRMLSVLFLPFLVSYIQSLAASTLSNKILDSFSFTTFSDLFICVQHLVRSFNRVTKELILFDQNLRAVESTCNNILSYPYFVPGEGQWSLCELINIGKKFHVPL